MVIDLAKKYNSYFSAYLETHNIKEFHDYSHWITDKHEEFRRMKGCPYCNGYPPDVQAEFEKFIRVSDKTMLE
ncbi:MAG: hypothetical protein RBT06_06370 [Smithellaceae bacterium]|nr:hypothetical protein [Smithellaceae bacterium]